LTKRYVVVRYAEDVFEPVAEAPLRSGDSPELYPSDGFFGEGLMPIKLERLLDSEADADH
jgi:hypothetical protein